MRKEKEQMINGFNFKVTQLGFADGMELLTTIGRIIGPVLSDPHKGARPSAMKRIPRNTTRYSLGCSSDCDIETLSCFVD